MIPLLSNIGNLIGGVLDLVGVSAERALQTLGALLRQTYKIEALPGLVDLSSGPLEAIANVWGTEDWVVKLGLVGGYRDQLLGLGAKDPVKTVFNIEIKGATHSSYMRRDDSKNNDPKVNEFVTALMINSKDKNTMKAFLDSDRRIHFNPVRNVYEVDPYII